MANNGYSILDVINEEYGVILTKNGCISVAFRMYNPSATAYTVPTWRNATHGFTRRSSTCLRAASCTSRMCSSKRSMFPP